MIHFFIVLYGLSLSEAYNIRISGKVELGKELSKLFIETYSELGVLIKNVTPIDALGPSEDANSDKIPKEYNNQILNNNEQEQPQDLTVLDKMVQNEQSDVHLYGNHKLKKEANDGEPLNNVHLRSKMEK